MFGVQFMKQWFLAVLMGDSASVAGLAVGRCICGQFEGVVHLRQFGSAPHIAAERTPCLEHLLLVPL